LRSVPVAAFQLSAAHFSKAEGITVKVVAVGTSQALGIGRRGDADVIFLHDRAAEDKFMAGA
jgi:tungstate transport system substrate-binding protein